ncbi:MAG: hypothetical protein KIT60_02585 [Burkholderiaceae bacterium]|nr:hypothetical protein [Burkholderiaceae bacterium]
MSRRPSSHAAPAAARPAWRRATSACLRAAIDLLRTLFLRQLRLRRIGGRLAVALEDKAAARADARAAAQADTLPQDVSLGELTALLNGAPHSRRTLRYLAALELSLARKDPTGLSLYEVAPARLHAALRQLDGLAPQPLSPGLAALRARIVDAIGTQAQREQRLEMLMPRSDMMKGDKVEVAEARPSDFERASLQWHARDDRNP